MFYDTINLQKEIFVVSKYTVHGSVLVTSYILYWITRLNATGGNLLQGSGWINASATLPVKPKQFENAT